jgi:ParB family chromosome partitioning protein
MVVLTQAQRRHNIRLYWTSKTARRLIGSEQVLGSSPTPAPVSWQFGLTTVPVQVKSLDDHSAREVQIIENLQRQDVHPLEEADGYRPLLDGTPSCTIDEVAAKVGKSKAYVYQRLSLTRLAPQVREVVATDALPLSYALKLAPLDPETQLTGLERCFRPLGGDAST